VEAPSLYLLCKGTQYSSKKGAIVRKIRHIWQLSPDTLILFEDETTIRFFPPLRHCWAYKGEQAVVPITGENAKRVLFGTINFIAGHRVLLRRQRQRQEDFQVFLKLLRKRYKGRPLALLLDKNSCHCATRSRTLAAQLNIALIWLPKQWSELNAMDHLWKEMKKKIASNRQFKTIDKQVSYAEKWVLNLSNRTALRKAGVLSKNFWLKNVRKNF
jgi:hypothetical protein